MKLLAFDTATDVCTVAVLLDGAVHERREIGRRHAERLLVMIDEALVDAGATLRGLDAICFGRGPGSFTGLRICAGVAQGLAFGADLPVVAVSSLAATAQFARSDRVLAAFDARMQQVYWGAFVADADGLVQLEGDERVIAPSAVPVPAAPNWIGAGNGWEPYAAPLRKRLGDRLQRWRAGCYPSARCVAELGARDFRAGKAVAAEQALPVYLRDDVAVKNGENKRRHGDA
ncbi:MAG TPA: tRNA (adenosine(37)-N6)-threonylcarbamoyltransferase complex dimerization subunit type 1 TsaB [Burkholderiales bacterium]|jgi:tRNA threonylcarbamoyladenosine biosynthesis protein TsaB